MSRARRKNRNRKGIAAVECAVVLPILLLVIAATLDICNLIFLRQQLTVAAYEGARVAINPNSGLDDIESQVRTILDQRGIVVEEIGVTPEDFESSEFGTAIEVSISANVSKNTAFNGVFANDKVVISSMTMMKEQ